MCPEPARGVDAADNHQAVDPSPGPHATRVSKAEWHAPEIVAYLGPPVVGSADEDNVQVLELFEDLICCSNASVRP